MRNLLHIFAQLRAAYSNRTDPEGLQLLARMYWRLILLLSVFAICASLAGGALQLRSTLSTLGEQSDQASETTPLLDKDTLHETLRKLDERKSRFEALKTGTSTLADPLR